MAFQSILSRNAKDSTKTISMKAPTFFGDLNLDQVVNAITAGKEGYDLKPFFYTPLAEIDGIYYRQEVMRDMEDPKLMAAIKAFAEKMSTVRQYLGMVEKFEFHYHKNGWFLEAALVYCSAVTGLERDLRLANLKSHGLSQFLTSMTRYIQSARYHSLQAEADKVKDGLADIRYCVVIQTGKFKVRKYEGEPDYSLEVERTFEKFQQDAVKDYRVQIHEISSMNYIEAQILDFVAQLYPEQFAALDQFCKRHKSFVDENMRVFDREIQFYIAYLEFIADIKDKGLSFCYPTVSRSKRRVYATEAFDLALARSLLYSKEPVICNDFYLEEPERIAVVSGPNQGGKTTFARMFGQLHYLARLGCPVPGREAQLFFFDQIFAHFEREGDIRSLRGKLQDDLIRIHKILGEATPDSILILNEIFASTTLEDAVFLSKEIMGKLLELDLLCVWVTFIDELSTWSEKTASMVSTVVPENPAVRTFKIIRKPADGLAYALSIAKKHRLTYEQITERIQT
jgi:DNA mismatch repair protein MutS